MDKKSEIDKLKKRLNEIEPILNKTFKTSSDLKKHVEQNKSLYAEGKDLSEQIEHLEYEQMTPKEKTDHDEYQRLSKLKAQGKFPL